MNDAVELWSTPWHELQRRLANGFGADEATGGSSRPLVGTRMAPQAAAGSWLLRARRMTPRAFVNSAD